MVLYLYGAVSTLWLKNCLKILKSKNFEQNLQKALKLLENVKKSTGTVPVLLLKPSKNYITIVGADGTVYKISDFSKWGAKKNLPIILYVYWLHKRNIRIYRNVGTRKNTKPYLHFKNYRNTSELIKENRQ